ncbi:MAG: hypothetical protein ACOYBJ_01840 [Patescibacteria group bacterium]|jgi:hypothetical protein
MIQALIVLLGIALLVSCVAAVWQARPYERRFFWHGVMIPCLAYSVWHYWVPTTATLLGMIACLTGAWSYYCSARRSVDFGLWTLRERMHFRLNAFLTLLFLALATWLGYGLWGGDTPRSDAVTKEQVPTTTALDATTARTGGR